MSKEILLCKDITFKYSERSKREIVKDFSFSFVKGEIYLISGYSGCGKSTLAYLLTGLYPANKGVLTGGGIYLEERSIESIPLQERAKKISMMFQNSDTQFCMESVEEEIIFVLENINYPVEKMDEKVVEVLKRCGILHLKKRRLTTLSGGEKQKVALASILALNSEVIVLDEPFANVDYESSQEIIEILLELNKTYGTTLIIIDHRISLWERVDYKLILLDKGCQISAGGVEALEDRCDIGEKRYIEEDKKECIAQIRDLKLSYGDNILAQGLTFEIAKGKITSIIGKSGSGKSTLLNTLCGIERYQDGSYIYDGKEFKKLKEREVLKEVGIVFQNPQNQFIAYKVIDELLFTLNRVYKGREKENIEVAEKLLKEFNLYDYRNGSPYSLSQGQQRKLAVLSMLCGEQRVLLCDEPTYGQDNKTSREIMEFLQKKSREGLSVVLVSHDIDLVAEYSDYIYEFKDKELKRVEYI